MIVRRKTILTRRNVNECNDDGGDGGDAAYEAQTTYGIHIHT